MTKYIALTLTAWIIISIFFVPTEIAFSQPIKDTIGRITKMPVGDSPYVKGITAGRTKALIGVAVGLISLIIGVVSRRRYKKQIGRGKGKSGAIVSLVLGVIGIILSILHLSTSVGAVFGSGSGKAGAIFALILSLMGIIFSWPVLRQKTM